MRRPCHLEQEEHTRGVVDKQASNCDHRFWRLVQTSMSRVSRRNVLSLLSSRQMISWWTLQQSTMAELSANEVIARHIIGIGIKSASWRLIFGANKRWEFADFFSSTAQSFPNRDLQRWLAVDAVVWHTYDILLRFSAGRSEQIDAAPSQINRSSRSFFHSFDRRRGHNYAVWRRFAINWKGHRISH